ncbi:MAG: glycosyltransferase family 2 protein [Provencibacterium sp.]|nr:glycosyltransferase family 2 protein [Provencibacterium sp.]
MKLQNILFPRLEICREEELYFRRDAAEEILCKEGEVRFPVGGVLRFDTYFNALSIGKWQEYAAVSEIQLHLEFCGGFRISLFNEEEWEEEVRRADLGEHTFRSPERRMQTVAFPPLPAHSCGLLGFSLTATDPDSRFYGGYYSGTPATPIRPVKIGVVICTFRREAFVQKNLLSLRDAFFNGNCPEMEDKLEFFIVDNAQTFTLPFSDPRLHLFPNQNTGGSGGFTRGLLELLQADPSAGFTHALLMDDDIVLEPEAVYRTYCLLALQKEAYTASFVGGAMLRLDRPAMQAESGARWNAGALISLKAGLDLRRLEDCLQNERTDPADRADYNAWWYCCFPLETVRTRGLPLPLFIRGDDVEFGLRHMQRLIQMNGICVWHEPFENKLSSSLYYYIYRNRLIDNAARGISYGKREAWRDLARPFLRELLCYRFLNARLLLRAAADFLLGTRWLEAQDGERLHQEILNSGYRLLPLSDLKREWPDPVPVPDKALSNYRESRFQRCFRLLTLNGNLLPASRAAAAPAFEASPIYFYRVKKALHLDAQGEKGFVTGRSLKEAFACLSAFFRITFRILLFYDHAVDDYLRNAGRLTTPAFWNRYLGRQNHEVSP